MHRTPLFIAAQHGYDEILRTLLASGASPFIASYNNKLPISVARSEEARRALTNSMKVKQTQKQFESKLGSTLKFHIGYT
jgi:ankyrin repeat protein